MAFRKLFAPRSVTRDFKTRFSGFAHAPAPNLEAAAEESAFLIRWAGRKFNHIQAFNIQSTSSTAQGDQISSRNRRVIFNRALPGSVLHLVEDSRARVVTYADGCRILRGAVLMR